MRSKLAALLVATVPVFGAACGGGVQEDLQQRVEEEVEEGKTQIEQEVEKGRTQVEEQIEGGRTQIEEEIPQELQPSEEQ